MNSLDKNLLRPATYERVILRLKERLKLERNGFKKSPIVKGLNLDWILENQQKVVKKIISAIQQDDFNFSPMKKIELKTGDKIREIYLTNMADKILMMAIHDLASEDLKGVHSPSVHSFRKGFGPKTAALSVSTYLRQQSHDSYHFIGRDISSYGDNIDHEIMDKILEELDVLKSSKLFFKLLKASYKCEYFVDDPTIRVSIRKGIPSGSPLVPLLENLYLSCIDKALTNLKDAFYARYGDDFIFLTPHQDQSLEAAALIRDKVAKLRLSVGQNKAKDFTLLREESSIEGPRYFEWIGTCFYADGNFSFRPKHRREYVSRVRREIGNFTYHLSSAELTQEHLKECVNIGFNELNHLNHLPESQKILVLRTHIKNTKLIDKNTRNFIVRCLCKVLKIRKREAWKFFRKLRLDSLEHRRRLLKINKIS